MGYDMTLPALEMNEQLIHSLLDAPCFSKDTSDTSCIVERIKEALQFRAGCMDSDSFSTVSILSKNEDDGCANAYKEAPWNKEDGNWGYSFLDITEEGYVDQAIASGFFSCDIRGFSFLCEMLIDKSLEDIDEDYITKFINDLDDEQIVYEDLYMDLMDDDEDEREESIQMYRDFVCDETVSLWKEILQAKKHGLQKDGELYSLMDDYSQIFQGYLSPEMCFSYIEELMHFTFGFYSGVNRCMNCYSSREIGEYLKVRERIDDCFEKRLLEHSLDVISNTCDFSSSEHPLVQYSCMDDNSGYYSVIIATSDSIHFSTLENCHPYWMYAVTLADILAPVCISKVSAACKAA